MQLSRKDEEILAEIDRLQVRFDALGAELRAATRSYDTAHDGTSKKQRAITEMNRLSDLRRPIELRMGELSDQLSDAI